MPRRNRSMKLHGVGWGLAKPHKGPNFAAGVQVWASGIGGAEVKRCVRNSWSIVSYGSKDTLGNDVKIDGERNKTGMIVD
jgi:hypothetical protein